MVFAEPLYLIALALWLLVGGAALVRIERLRRAHLTSFGERPLLERASALPRGRLRAIGQALALGAVALGLVALARPQLGEKPIVLSRTGRDVLFALDLSRSMNAEDVAPSRLAAAKRAVRELLESSPGDRVGLVVFGGSAFLQVPLTLDRAAFELFLDAAETDDMSDPGTNLPVALAAAATGFGRDSEPRYRAVVLLSDGEDTAGQELGGALAELEKSGIRVFALGLGTPEGGPIPTRIGERLLGYHRDAAGEVVVTRLEEDALRRVAQETGGTYSRYDDGAGVRRLAAEIRQIERREISSRTFTELADRYQWPLAVALGAIVLESLLAERGAPRRPARSAGEGEERPGTPRAGRAARKAGAVRAGCVALLTAAGCALLAPTAVAQARDGERHYRAGRFEEAYRAFQQAGGEEPSPALAYNAGNALYRLGRYAQAAAGYRDALAGAPPLRQKGSYNLGNALVRTSETMPDKRETLRAAVTAYEEALVLNPADAAAKWNLELALRKLAEEEQRAGGGAQGNEEEDADGEGEGGGGEPPAEGGGAGGQGMPESAEQPEPPAEPSGGALTEAQARQLLEAIQGEEGEALEDRGPRRGRVSAGARDW